MIWFGKHSFLQIIIQLLTKLQNWNLWETSRRFLNFKDLLIKFYWCVLWQSLSKLVWLFDKNQTFEGNFTTLLHHWRMLSRHQTCYWWLWVVSFARGWNVLEFDLRCQKRVAATVKFRLFTLQFSHKIYRVLNQNF